MKTDTLDIPEEVDAGAAEIHRQAMAVWRALNDGLTLLACRQSMRQPEFNSEAEKAIKAIAGAIKENPRATDAIIDPMPRAADAIERLTAANRA